MFAVIIILVQVATDNMEGPFDKNMLFLTNNKKLFVRINTQGNLSNG